MKIPAAWDIDQIEDVLRMWGQWDQGSLMGYCRMVLESVESSKEQHEKHADKAETLDKILALTEDYLESVESSKEPHEEHADKAETLDKILALTEDY